MPMPLDTSSSRREALSKIDKPKPTEKTAEAEALLETRRATPVPDKTLETDEIEAERPETGPVKPLGPEFEVTQVDIPSKEAISGTEKTKQLEGRLLRDFQRFVADQKAEGADRSKIESTVNDMLNRISDQLKY